LLINFLKKHSVFKILCLLIVSGVFLFTGCTVKLIYKHLDWIIPWYVDDYITLNVEQESLLEKQLKAQLKWHRVTQLARYSKSLKELREGVNRGLTYEDMDRFHNIMRGYWQDLVSHISPDMAKLLASASDEQINELLENLKRRNEKFKAKYIDLTDEELREKKVERMERFLDFTIGSINSEQEKIIERWSFELKNIARERLDFIKKSQGQLRKMLKNRKDEKKLAEDLKELLFFRRETWPEDFKVKAAHNRELTKRTFAALFNTISDEQRTHLTDQINYLAEAFDELSSMEE
jgi:hypothetical protein